MEVDEAGRVGWRRRAQLVFVLWRHDECRGRPWTTASRHPDRAVRAVLMRDERSIWSTRIETTPDEVILRHSKSGADPATSPLC